MILVTCAAYADTRTYAIKADGKNSASFRLPDALESIDGVTYKVSGTIAADPLDPEAATVDVSIDLGSLDTGIALRNRHMRERYVETGKYPRASFKSVSVSSPSKPINANQPVELNITGDFTMHGVTKRVNALVRVIVIPESDITRNTRGAGDWIHATTTFKLKLSDFGIDVPDGFVDDTLDAKLDVFALAGK
ncbi:MAG: YceI family protein [Thermoanaerobaculia bacterium]